MRIHRKCALFRNLVKRGKQIYFMQERIGFRDESARKKFFVSVRAESGAGSWRALSSQLGLRRTRFQMYQYGARLLPKSLFNSMSAFLPKEKKESFLKQTFVKPGNWGRVKGGNTNYQRNSALVIGRLRSGFENKIVNKLARLECIFLNSPLSEELCEFIGALIGDGCIDSYVTKSGRPKYHINITGDAKLDKNYLTTRISPIVCDIFKVTPHIYFRKDCRAMVLNFYSKPLFSMLTKRFGFLAANKTFTVKIPEEIIASNEKFIFATIRGIFDTDGNVFIDKRKIYTKQYGRITIKTASGPLYYQLEEFLQKHFSLYSAVKMQKNVPICEITIYGNKQIEKWMRLVGFSNERHLSKIRVLFGSSEWDLNPRPATLPVLLNVQGSRATTAPSELKPLLLANFTPSNP